MAAAIRRGNGAIIEIANRPRGADCIASALYSYGYIVDAGVPEAQYHLQYEAPRANEAAPFTFINDTKWYLSKGAETHVPAGTGYDCEIDHTA
jgi:hypothetical protein